MMDIVIYIVLVVAIVFMSTVVVSQKKIIKKKDLEIVALTDDLSETNDKLDIKQERLDALKMRFIAENTMVRRRG